MSPPGADEFMKDDPLFRPCRLKHLTLKNRLMSTAHEPDYGDDGMPGSDTGSIIGRKPGAALR